MDTKNKNVKFDEKNVKFDEDTVFNPLKTDLD
jgi:hypothetical protein